MVDCKPISTPVDTHAKVSAKSGPPVADLTHFRSLTGALQYLTFTRRDITYAIQQICLHMHDLREPHLTTMKLTLCYLWGTLDYADWAGCSNTRWCTSGYAVFLDTNLISLSLKHQNIVSCLSAEAEYRAVANGVAEAC
jgi:hypothetical protein